MSNYGVSSFIYGLDAETINVGKNKHIMCI